jgi:regulator of protease activity HflC (stomatin/prohibitin superfamily)
MNKEIKTILTYAGYVVLGIFGFSAFLGSFYINSEYERTVVTRLGEINGPVSGPGLHFKVPFIDSAHTADIRISEINYPDELTASFDGQTITIDITINHQILEASVQTLYSDFGSNYNYSGRILKKMAIDRIKGLVGTYKIEEFMPNRELIRQEALNVVKEEAAKYGVNILDIQLANFEFDARFRTRLEGVADARARASQAEQKAREAGFEADKRIEQERGEAESKKLAADAEAFKIRVESEQKAAAIQREGEAQAASELAKGRAKAEAIKAQLEALEKGGQNLVELTKAEAMKNWDGVYSPDTVITSGGDGTPGFIPFMNYNELLKPKTK